MPNLIQEFNGAASRPIFSQIKKCKVGMSPHTTARNAEIIVKISMSFNRVNKSYVPLLCLS
jgi:hypothetical protein